MSNCAIVGINWGDEGKGRMVDLVTADYDVVVRYQGGGNAGHTVVNEFGKFALHLLPSGIFRKGVVNILGNGVALDCESLWTEMSDVMDQGVAITPENLKISDRASLLLPWHRDLDSLEEARLADKKYGSTKQGIAPFYSDKYQKKTIMAGELLYPEKLWDHLAGILEWKNLTLERVYGAKPYTMDDLKAWVTEFGEKIKPFICDTGAFLRQAQAEGKHILFEAQLGSLRDLDYGIYPYTTSSNPIAAYAPVGSGLPTAKLDKIIGVVKAYSSCVGEGPFTEPLAGEGAFPHAGGVGLHHAHHLVQLGTGQPGAHGGVGGDGVGGGGVGVDAEIQIPQSAQLALKEDGLAVCLRLPQPSAGVSNEGADGSAEAIQPCQHLLHGVALSTVDLPEDQVLPLQQVLQMGLQVLRIQKLSGLNGLFLVFIGIEGGDALLGGAVLLVLETGLLQCIQLPVPRQQQGGPVADQQVFRGNGHSGGPQRLDLRQEIFAVQRHAVAEDVHDTLVENAGGQQMQGELAHVVDDGVAGVAATLIPDHDVKPLG